MNQQTDLAVEPCNDETDENVSSQQIHLLSIATVRKMFDNVSDMTIWRWLQDENLNFPKPMYVNRSRFWRADELNDWIENRPRETDA